MKGPGFRLDLDVRRIWECPECGRCLKRSGGVTQIDCDCRLDAPVAMRLVEKCHKTESPFDHVGFAAQKRIDAALRKPHDVPPEDAAAEFAPSGEVAANPGSEGVTDVHPPTPLHPETESRSAESD
ncbi:MAG: hypothetical protein WBC44_22700 [Planctomycetaceae bacterium]